MRRPPLTTKLGAFISIVEGPKLGHFIQFLQILCVPSMSKGLSFFPVHVNFLTGTSLTLLCLAQQKHSPNSSKKECLIIDEGAITSTPPAKYVSHHISSLAFFTLRPSGPLKIILDALRPWPSHIKIFVSDESTNGVGGLRVFKKFLMKS